MSRNKFNWTGGVLAALGLLLSVAPAAAGGMTGDQVVELMDKSMTGKAKDQYFIFDMLTEQAGQKTRQMQFAVTIKGTKWRLIEFRSPGDVAGMRILVLSLDQMYTYLPAYKKVRRIASHVKSQGFMGTAFGHEEMAIATYGDVFSAKLVGETDKEWKLVLERRPGQDFPHAMLEMTARKDVLQPVEIAYLNDKGVKVKSESRSSYECRDNLCNPRVIVLTDHTRGDIKTTMVRREWKVNTGVGDDFFTVRALQRSR